jgi:hypothetical protein
MVNVSNLYANVVGYFNYFLTIDVGNLYTNVRGYVGLSLVMTDISNIDENLGWYFVYCFIMAETNS